MNIKQRRQSVDKHLIVGAILVPFPNYLPHIMALSQKYRASIHDE